MERLIEIFSATIGQFVSPEIFCFLISMVPLLELRGGLLVAASLKVPMMTAIPLCVIGNIIPIPFILLFIKKIFQWTREWPVIGAIVKKLEARADKKSDFLEKGEFIGLMLFVGIPLPGTGAWTGALVASLLDMDLKKASLAILCGIVLATIIMTVVSYGTFGVIGA